MIGSDHSNGEVEGRVSLNTFRQCGVEINLSLIDGRECFRIIHVDLNKSIILLRHCCHW